MVPEVLPRCKKGKLKIKFKVNIRFMCLVSLFSIKVIVVVASFRYYFLISWTELNIFVSVISLSSLKYVLLSMVFQVSNIHCKIKNEVVYFI